MSESLGPLFTVEGAVVDARGRLKNLAYVEFITKFNAESRDRSQHPFPASPGLRAEECELSQLRCWEDKKGAGWVAQGQGKSAWFSLSSWGSWRLALLLAKLQRDLWQRGAQENPAGEAEGPAKRPRKSSHSSTPKEAKGGGRGKGRPKNEETPSTEAQKPAEQPEKKDENAKVRRGPGRPKKDTPKEVPSSKAQGPLEQEQKDKEHKDEVKVHRGPGRPKKETPKEVPLSSEPHGPTEKPPERNDEEDREDPKASARARLAAAAEEDLPQLVAEGLLVNLVRAKGWHLIFNPKWEGDRWRKMLQDLQSGADFSLEELHQEVRQKLRRQATGQKLANSRLHRERAEQRRREQQESQARPAPRPSPAPEWRAPERVPGCTCGRPIHSERCRLFRPRMRPEEEARSRARKPQRPEGPAATCRAVPSMTAAQRKVLKLENYIKSQPKALQKTLWKRALLRYHPDKALAQSEASEPKSAEVFIEVKRKYDLFVSG
ncbi:unnamed protein product [Cladocopium goreaui]|uniref:TFIIS N-terminal domain-containing protein n=1 Tax=Cladocopium goreaui TaxID=2562237 RepID=A0A9P1CTS1_9DINO|nr:unnamed protein product [Cladocopium goreaui]